MKWLILFTLFSLPASAFTLNNNFVATFATDEVRVTIDSKTTCSGIMDVYELEALIKPALDNFWNRVPTSRLRLKYERFATSAGTIINNGVLCSPTDDECVDNAGNDLIPPVDGIVIGCNNNPVNFGGATSSNVLGVTIPNHFTGRKIKGAVILINENGLFRSLSESDKISVIAHEVGHAIGLGHAEEHNREALMYYKVVNLRRSLAQDDIDGVSYLYPIKFDGCGLFGATVMDLKQDPPASGQGGMTLQMGLGFLLMLLMGRLAKLLRRPKACAAL
jgi:hypothetical protein